MRRLSLSLPRAYLLVRARRLNVIIQPNLLFMYELMKWEELEFSRTLEQNSQDDNFIGHREYKREMEWSWLCREIADLNKSYNATA
jgi:dual specificity MAP kinase phosphatase